MRRITAVVVLLVGCVSAVPADAAWTSPVQLPGSAARYPLFAAFGPTSTTIGLYGPLALTPGTPQVPLAVSSTSTAGAFGAPVGLPDKLGAPVAVSPGGTMLAVGGPRSPLDYFGPMGGPRVRLRVAVGPVGGVLTRVATGGVAATRTLASAVNDAGDAAVVFARCLGRDCRMHSIGATFRRRGHAFSKTVVLSKRTAYPVAAVALNPAGDAILAWVQHGLHGRNDINARVRHSDGTLTKLRVAGPTAPVPTIAVTLSSGRHGTVAWFSERVIEGSDGGPFAVYESEIDSRGTMSGRNMLDGGNPTGHGGADAVPGVRLRSVLGPDGVPTFAWTGFVDGHYVVRAARVFRDVEDPSLLSSPDVDTQLMDLANDGAGDTLAVWGPVAGATPAAGVAAVIQPAGSTAFGPPQIVLTGSSAIGSAAGAIAPGGRAIVAGGPAPTLGRGNGPGVLVTQLMGSP